MKIKRISKGISIKGKDYMLGCYALDFIDKYKIKFISLNPRNKIGWGKATNKKHTIISLYYENEKDLALLCPKEVKQLFGKIPEIIYFK